MFNFQDHNMENAFLPDASCAGASSRQTFPRGCPRLKKETRTIPLRWEFVAGNCEFTELGI